MVCNDCKRINQRDIEISERMETARRLLKLLDVCLNFEQTKADFDKISEQLKIGV